MGRPEDEFVRKHAEKSENGWKCKYCNREFKKTSVSRMRVHLSSRGDSNISGCGEVPNEVAAEALEKIKKKRARKSSEGEVNDCVSVNVADPRGKSVDHFTQRGHEEHVTDALVKFLMLTKITAAVSDFIKDPNLREFLERVHQYGVPSGLLMGENRVIKKSLVNVEDVVDKYKSEVMSSWKTTGCTMICYNPKDMKVKSSNPAKGMYAVLGFYSPKGFIFFEGPDLKHPHYRDLKTHLRSLVTENVTIHFMEHLWDSDLFSCEFSDADICFWMDAADYPSVQCICHDVQNTCISVCEESEWAQGLIKKAEHIHHCLADYSLQLHKKYYKYLKEKDFNGFENGNHASPLSRFRAIMLLRGDALNRLLQLRCDWATSEESKEQLQAENKRILYDYQFWADGLILNRVLTRFLTTIPDIMDTLVPTAGYLSKALDKVMSLDAHMCMSENGFLEALKFDLSNRYANAYSTAFLNPIHLARVSKDEVLKLKEAVKKSWWQSLCSKEKDEDHQREEFEIQVERYISEIDNNLMSNQCHPVKLWQEYGGDYPLLQKYAIEVLSRPVSCMCNQVKKHILQLEGADDYILRLNMRMMEEYKNLGDNIYNPIDLEEILNW